MSFYGTSFIFDGIPCEEFGLMLYDLDSHEQEDGTIGTSVNISEDRLWGNPIPIHYGTSENEALTIKLICVVPENNKRLTRFDIAKVAGWLKTPSYRILKIVQPDMDMYFYKCIFTELVPIKIGLETIGIEATALCDGPYAYMASGQLESTCNGTSSILIRNHSNVNRYCYPKVVLSTNGGNVSIINETDNNREMKIENLPLKDFVIDIDGNTGIIKAQDDTNMYQYFNFNFPRLLRGDNKLKLSGNFTMTVNCEFLMDIGN